MTLVSHWPRRASTPMTKAVAPKAGTAVPVVNRGLPAVNLQMLNRVAIKRRGGRKERGKEGREGGRTLEEEMVTTQSTGWN